MAICCENFKNWLNWFEWICRNI